jgi:hypothetical protein
MPDLLANRFVIAVSVPIVFLLAGGFAKKLVYGGWKWEYFCLGVEGTLAAISSSLIQIAELTSKIKVQGAEIGIIHGSVSFLAIALLLLLILLGLQQDWEKNKESWVHTLLWGVVSNILGVGSLAVFLIWFKGV